MKIIRLKALLGLYGLVLLSGILQSCCKQEYKFIGLTEMIAFEPNIPTDNTPMVVTGDADTVFGAFYLRVYFDYEFQASYQTGLLSSSYATSCLDENLNEVDLASFVLTADQDIPYGEGQISAGDNLLDLATIEKSDYSNGSNSIDETSTLLSNYYDILFTNKFLEAASLEETEYTFTFTGRTTDGINLRFEKKLFAKI